MKNLLLYALCLLSPCIFAASPAATQEWVRQYIATTVVQTASASADFRTNSVQGVMNNIELARIADEVSRTNPCMRVSFTTNALSRMILAQTNETDFVNVPRLAILHLTTNSASFVVGTEYSATTNEVQTMYVDFGDLSIGSAFATDDELNNAKGL